MCFAFCSIVSICSSLNWIPRIVTNTSADAKNKIIRLSCTYCYVWYLLCYVVCGWLAFMECQIPHTTTCLMCRASTLNCEVLFCTLWTTSNRHIIVEHESRATSSPYHGQNCRAVGWHMRQKILCRRCGMWAATKSTTSTTRDGDITSHFISLLFLYNFILVSPGNDIFFVWIIFRY